MSECEKNGHVYVGPMNGTAGLQNSSPLYICTECNEPGWDLAARPALTLKQAQLLDAIFVCLEDLGYPPSIKELGDLVGFKSTSSVVHQLKNLERKGYIRRDPDRARAITIAEGVWQS